MDIKTILAVISGIFSLAAYFPYIIAILKPGSTVKPNRATWFVWWLVDIIGAITLYYAGQFNVLPMFIAWTCGSSVVLILSIKRGVGGLSREDLICVAIALVGVAVWQISGNPSLGIIFQLLAAAAGSVPTIIKTWKDPTSEDKLAWQLMTAGGLTNTLAIKSTAFAAVVPPLTILMLQLPILIPIMLHSRRVTQTA